MVWGRGSPGPVLTPVEFVLDVRNTSWNDSNMRSKGFKLKGETK